MDGLKFTAGIGDFGIKLKGVESMVKSYEDIIGASPAFGLGSLESHESLIDGLNPSINGVKSITERYDTIAKSIGNTQ